MEEMKTSIGEHSYLNVSCLEYCTRDPAYCPLRNMTNGDGSPRDLKATVTRYDGKPYTISCNYVGISRLTDKEKRELKWSGRSCWSDGSGFEYDLMPENLVGPSSSVENSLYELNSFPIETSPLKFDSWNTWIEKFQRDYRFGAVSDLNAETILFPDVDDPWMFTEYAFQGTGNGETIVEPPLYDDNTLAIINADTIVTEKNSEKYEAQEGAKVKGRRTVIGWDELADGYPISVRDQSGVLYKVNVPVQSVKWGEHGNIPPDTLNMAAPEKWMNPDRLNPVIRPRYVAHIGVGYYAKNTGVLYWWHSEAWVDENISQGERKTLQDGTPYYKYPVQERGEHGIRQELPSGIRTRSDSRLDGVDQGETKMVSGDLVHCGCEYFQGTGGRATCRLLDTLTGGDRSTVASRFDFEKCINGTNTSCPFQQKRSSYPLIASYSTRATDLAQYKEKMFGVYSGEDATRRAWADSVLSPGGTIGTALFGMMFGNFSRYGRDDIYNQEDVSVWYEAQFDIEYESDNSARTTKQQGTGNGFSRGVEVIRGSGRRVLDTKENSGVFKGDTPFFGDFDQGGFSRWYESAMFCASAAYCNETCGNTMCEGFSPGERAGDAEQGKCRYWRASKGRIGCPTNRVQKRALEFQETMVRATAKMMPLAQMLLELYVKSDNETNYIALYNSDESSPYYFRSRGEIEFGRVKYLVWDVYSPEKNVGISFGGAWNSEKAYSVGSRNLYLTGKIRLLKSGQSEGEPYAAYFWYLPLDNKGNPFPKKYAGSQDGSENSSLFPNNALWLCRCDQNFRKFKYNTMIVTNDKKFIGGYHPQYKDYSKMGEEFLQDVESTDYRDAMGDIIGDPEHDGQPQAVNKKGYWTDMSGEYIMDEKSLGLGDKILGDDDREGAGANTISIKKSNTEVDGSTGETKGVKTTHCAVQLNDPKVLLEYYKTNGERKMGMISGRMRSKGRPLYEEPGGEGEYWAPPYVGDKDAIPTMRMAAHCPNCGYYLAYKYHSEKCPWCGGDFEVVEGDDGSSQGWTGEDAIGNSWSEDAPVIKKLFKLNAIGMAQVWAPPGTCIPLDGYYWRNPALVTHTLIRQLKQRLGEWEDGSWKGNKTPFEKYLTLGYPEQRGYFLPVPDIAEDESDREHQDDGKPYEDMEWTDEEKSNRSRYASYNPATPANSIPGIDGDAVDERIIAPYSAKTEDALKIVTGSWLVNLRNRLEPLFSYTSWAIYNPDYPATHASYEKREDPTAVPTYSTKRRCTVDPVILAANNTGMDFFVQFFSGDAEWGSVREYYPPALSWWWLNKCIGGIYSDLTGGWYHMDGWYMKRLGIDHFELVSKCAMFLHGIVPLDKEIVAAYAIVEPAGEPNKEPIGRGWNGTVHWLHYHARTTNHKYGYSEADTEYGPDGSIIKTGPLREGEIKHLHGQAGYKGNWDENGDYRNLDGSLIYSPDGSVTEGDEVRLQDAGDHYGWAVRTTRISGYRPLYDDPFKREWTGIAGAMDCGFWRNYGMPKENYGTGTPIYSYNEENESMDAVDEETPEGEIREKVPIDKNLWYNGRISSRDKFHDKFHYVGLDLDGNLRFLTEKNDIWQNTTQSEMREIEEQNLTSVQFVCSDGDPSRDIVADFQQYTSDYINKIYPEQTQGIPGYYDLSGNNGTQEMYERLSFAAKNNDSSKGEIVLQDAGGSDPDGYYGGNYHVQLGIVPRVFDITEKVKWHYNRRIARDFICKGGKAPKEVMKQTFPEPIWNGVGEWPQDKMEAAKKWNGQLEKDDFGYLLTDEYTYPKLASDNSVPEPKNTGEKYELQSEEISLLVSFLPPITVKIGSCRYHILVNGVGQAGEFQTGRYSTIAQVKSLIQTMFGNEFTIMEASASSLTVKASANVKSLEIRKTEDSCYSLFSGIEEGIYFPHANRVIAYSSYSQGCHPMNALLETPTPWVTNQYSRETQYIVVDLARAPLETSERDFRFNPPTVNCANVHCPNPSCSSQPYTAGVYGQRKGVKMGDGNTTCPGCGRDLSKEPGVVSKNGDGLYSYYYDEPFAENAIITYALVNAEKQSWRLSIKDSEQPYWLPVLSCDYNEETGKYTYTTIDGSVYDGEPDDWYSVREMPYRARYARLEIRQQRTSEKKTFSSGITRAEDRKLVISGEFSDYGLFNWRGIPIEVMNTANIVSELHLSDAYIDEEGRLVLYTRETLPKEVRSVEFTVHRYTSSVDAFKIQGYHYKKSEMKFTGPWDYTMFFYPPGKTHFQLQEYPTQINNIILTKNGESGIALKETDDTPSFNLKKMTYTLKQEEEKELTYYVIVSGTYRFDPKRNRIRLSRYGICENKKILIADIEKELMENGISYSLLPSQLVVEYFTGSGLPVTLEATACGQGPSYQLEKGSINTIVSEELQNTFTSVPMPDMDGNIERREFTWTCMNNIPSTLSYGTQKLTNGKFRTQNFDTQRLGRTVDTDTFFVDLFGENCSNVIGLCKTEVTFYGPPMSVIKGNITVRAPAITERTIDTGGGNVVKTYERTGGLEYGALIFKMRIPRCKGRKSLCFGIPKIVIFARDRNPEDPLEK